MTRRVRRDAAEVLRDGPALDRAIVASQRRVVLLHRQLGIPLAIWRDGRVVEVSAHSIELPALPEPSPESSPAYEPTLER